MKRKPLKKAERKMLVFNKMNRKGLSYKQACKELEQELAYLEKQKEAKRIKKRERKSKAIFKLPNLDNG